MSTLEGEKTMQEKQPEVKAPEVKVYDVADFHIKCHGCGNDVVAIPNVKGGLRTDLFTTDSHKFIMECTKCGAKLEYYFTEAANPEPETEPQDDSAETEKAVEKLDDDRSKEEAELHGPQDDPSLGDRDAGVQEDKPLQESK